MKVTDLPVIDCEITFLSEQEGGRKQFGNGMLSGYQYRPHLVVGDINQRKAILDENKFGMEEYLGVVFFEGPEVVEPNIPIKVSMVLMYFPNVNYERLIPNATFTIREGAIVVGFGWVINRRENSKSLS
jgi:hypothetical protein